MADPENAQMKQKEYYDRNRSNVTFKARDKVIIDTKNLNLRHRNNGKAELKLKLAA